MPKTFIIIVFFLLSLILYLSDSFVYPIEEVEITSTTSNYDTKKINDIVASIQGQDLLSLDLSDIKKGENILRKTNALDHIQAIL